MEHGQWSVIPRGMERKQSWNRNNQYQARQVPSLHSNLFQRWSLCGERLFAWPMGDASSRSLFGRPHLRALGKDKLVDKLDQEERFWGPIFFFLFFFLIDSFFGQKPPAHHAPPQTGTWRPPTFFPLAVVAAWHPFLPEQRCPIRGSSSQQPIRAKEGDHKFPHPPHAEVPGPLLSNARDSYTLSRRPSLSISIGRFPIASSSSRFSSHHLLRSPPRSPPSSPFLLVRGSLPTPRSIPLIS